MAVYKLFPQNGSISAAAHAQKQAIYRQLQGKQFAKDTATLEMTLNEFFYAKQGNNYDKYYDRALTIAQEAFNERYSNFELDMEKMTAKFKNPNIYFVNPTNDINQIKALAKEIELYMKNTNITRGKWAQIINRINAMQSMSEWSDVKDINGIVASILLGNKTVYGDAFEYPLAAFAALLDEGAETTTDKLLQSFNTHLQGGVRSKSYLNISHVSATDKKNLKIKNSIIVNDGTRLEYTNPTQDKVDITLNLNGTAYNLSAKSYSSIYKDIHILGGASLSVPVLNLSSTDFVSHYLTQLYLKDGTLDDAHEAVRLNILFMALTGTGSSVIAADTFVINDKGSRKIYVRSMPDIIRSVANNNKWQALDINGAGPEIPDQALRNYQQYKMKNNIVSMISTMHAVKLQVSLKGSTIKDSIH